MSQQRAASQPTASQEASQFAAEALGLEYVPRPRSSREEDSRTTTTQPPLAALAEAAAAALPRAEIDDSDDDDGGGGGNGDSSDAAVADARYTYCGLCKSKHTKKMWGTWHRVTRDLATLARDRLGQPVAEGSFVCHNGYLNIMAVPGAPPVQIMPPFVPKQRSTSDINAALSQSLAAAAAVAVHKMISRQPSVPPSPATTAAAAAAAAAAANLPSAHLRAQQLASQHIVNRVLRDHELQQADSAERKSGSGSESEEPRMHPAPAKRHRTSFAASTAASAAVSSSSSAQQQSVGTMTEPLFSTSALVPRSVLLPKQEPRPVSPAFPLAAAAAAASAEDPKTPPTPLAIDPLQPSPEMLAKVVEDRIGARVDALAQTLENVNATCTALRATLDELSLRMSAQQAALPTAEELRKSLQSVCQVLQDLRRRDDRS